MLAPPLSVREAAAARLLPAVPAITQAATKGVPAELGVDRLFVHLVRRSHDHRAVRRRLVVVETLIVDGHAEEARGPVGQVARVLLFDGPANRLFALVDAEHELRSGALGARLDRAGPASPPGRRESCAGRCARRHPGRAGAGEHRRKCAHSVHRLARAASSSDATRSGDHPAFVARPHSSEASSDRRARWHRGTQASQPGPSDFDARVAARRAPRRRARAGVARPGTPRGMTGGLQGVPPGDARAARTCRSSLATPERWRTGTARCRRRRRRGRAALPG